MRAHKDSFINKWIVIALAGVQSQLCHGQIDGISGQGITGGLVIPSAQVLPNYAMALSFGNYKEPRFESRATEQNLIYGLGILPYVELIGRFAFYSDTPSGTYARNDGPRDLSANVKIQVPFLPEKGPQLAIGQNDVAGGAIHFKSTYVVATQTWRALSGSLGYAHGVGEGRKKTFDGAFGGLALRLGPTGLSLLAEYDGQIYHAGGRWVSPSIKKLGDLQMAATLHQAFGPALPSGKDPDAAFFSVGLRWPIGNFDIHRTHFQPAATAKLAEIPVEKAEGGSHRNQVEHLMPIRQALEAAGLERVRVGLRGDTSHQELVVEYENHRYGQNEVDAIGLVLGFGSELAPAPIQRIRAITLKDGLGIYETSVGVPSYRAFLRQGSVNPVRDSLTWRTRRSSSGDVTNWERETSYPTSRLRIELSPDLNYTLGTEVGAFDYSLAARLRLVAPLWTGARFTSSFVAPIDHSINMDRNGVFSASRHSSGSETISIGQSFWMGNRILLHVAGGRFHFKTPGLQSEADIFVPGTSDVLRLRGAAYHSEPGGVEGGDLAGAVSYRHQWTPSHWLEIGFQHYSDGTSGPLLEWTRWSSDVGVTVFGRQGGDARFAGLRISFPLTPRQGMRPYFAGLMGTSQYSESIRTLLTNAEQPSNLVQPSWVRELNLETRLEGDYFNSGRMGRAYMNSQLYRMREAFYLYGGNNQPQTLSDSRRIFLDPFIQEGYSKASVDGDEMKASREF